jgi:hypothetical protein
MYEFKKIMNKATSFRLLLPLLFLPLFIFCCALGVFLDYVMLIASSLEYSFCLWVRCFFLSVRRIICSVLIACFRFIVQLVCAALFVFC